VIEASEALARLRDGNARFAAGVRQRDHYDRQQLIAGQEPFAVVLGCSDSRVPVEIVFDQGLGDLFVIRVAGNIVAPSQVGSIEYAAEIFGTRLVVVLGHQKCGAVGAAIDQIQRAEKGGALSPGLRSIVDRIRPSISGLMATPLRDDTEALYREAVRSNVRVAADALRHGSAILERSIREDGLVVVGAVYSLETGLVDFFEGVPV